MALLPLSSAGPFFTYTRSYLSSTAIDARMPSAWKYSEPPSKLPDERDAKELSKDP